eukprot:scaffold546_cov352-Prasinococcus_capsulatus_cf.AAC.9
MSLLRPWLRVPAGRARWAWTWTCIASTCWTPSTSATARCVTTRRASALSPASSASPSSQGE